MFEPGSVFDQERKKHAISVLGQLISLSLSLSSHFDQKRPGWGGGEPSCFAPFGWKFGMPMNGGNCFIGFIRHLRVYLPMFLMIDCKDFMTPPFTNDLHSFISYLGTNTVICYFTSPKKRTFETNYSRLNPFSRSFSTTRTCPGSKTWVGSTNSFHARDLSLGRKRELPGLKKGYISYVWHCDYNNKWT